MNDILHGRLSICAQNLILLVLCSVAAFSQPTVLDQSFQAIGENALIADDLQTVAQTFTSAYDGYLAAVDLQIGREASVSTDLILQIRTTLLNNSPSRNVLLQLIIPSSQVNTVFGSQPGFNRFDLPNGAVPVRQGETLAIALLGVETSTGGATPYAWGFSEGIYSGGAAFTEIRGGGFVISPEHNFGFRTYVTIPEPSVAAFLLAGSFTFLLLKRKSL